MHSQSTFSIALTLISLLMAGQVLVHGEKNVDDKEIKSYMFENNICSIYDNSLEIDSVLFKKEYKPLVIIIADKISNGINRVISLNGSKRILNDTGIKNNPYYSQLHQTISKYIHLYQANDTYYFVLPTGFQDHILVIYSQKKLLDNNLGITFDFVNVKKEFPFFEDILIPLNPGCTNCTFVKYVNGKLEKGESFSELFDLRKQLFREKEAKNLSFMAVNDYDICDSIGFNINSQSMSSLLHFNSLLKQIQNDRESGEKNKKRYAVSQSLRCFEVRHLEEVEDIISGNERKLNFKNLMNTMNYLNWIINNVSALKSNDVSFGGLCENEHNIDMLKLFCFINKISDDTSHRIPEWIYRLKKFVAASLINKFDWFQELKLFYTNDYIKRKDLIFPLLDNLKHKMLTASRNLSYLMNITYKIVENSLTTNTYFTYDLKYFSICTIYEHWETIDDIFFEVKFKRLVIIVVDDMKQGIRIAKQIRGNRVVPKVMREDLHYSEQFLYDFIMKHIYLVQSNDTHYYVYPTIDGRNSNSLISYLEYKMIRDYSNVIFYNVNAGKYFPFDERLNLDNSDLVIPALPDYCRIPSGRCKKRYINPSYLIKVNQEFLKRFPKYLSLYTFIYNNLTEFTNNYDSHHKDNYYSSYHQTYYDFAKEQQFTYDIIYIFIDLPCLSKLKLNNRTDIDFNMTEVGDVLNFYKLLYSTLQNITSINDRNKINLKSLCSNKNVFKFLKFFCFLKINYIESMLKVIDQKSYAIDYMKSIVESEKNYITEYLLKTMDWIEKLLSVDYIDYKYNETRMIKESDALYSVIPKITLNGADLSNKIYSIVKNNTIFLQCNELGFVATKKTNSNADDSSTENYLVLSENKMSPQFQKTVINKEEKISSCLVPSYM
ncbi:uncharacterized protein LOC122510629 [Leptopilina heterotoma]|uniref:uncharacterized protein LOC122510629 n=1 Tax=Leptopilina heterotoma TaxID=63436 RepID=UPI001CA91EF1|nr:uncharacterized protein LOC122510629 [Leptopilina heterotoma]